MVYGPPKNLIRIKTIAYVIVNIIKIVEWTNFLVDLIHIDGPPLI